ncbi:enoyl-CoA hydratase/isomerase family protein [Chromatocurvus halotolerans]|uniref:2-(1,2-epoxy-1,2-dihydrophenyl)acetyl-CoA isomerase n=1 Tax=Chromatocurvus halotolerans TaxID=1132028 RepID=A0A4V2SC15_9GAMM|nr:enoyl-CoA hydratase-related protein [Chromatocurvus halotolerans]TCO77660.1 2-(1,2-epoxy-1,2-dihydrophenyl)acetyl-CoA isomerase [Chromatocurvus halotolerans]
MTTYDTVSVERRGAVALLTLNRPDSLNAFDEALRRDMLAAALAVNADNDVRVVVLTGAGRAFCAGADLTEVSSREEGGGLNTEAMLNTEYKPAVLAIAEAPKPWISAVNGAAAGIGSAFAMTCDLTVMGRSAYLYQAFAAIGLVPDGGATWQLVRVLGRKRAYEMMISGEKVRADRCLELGLCNRVVDDDALVDAAMAWAEELAEKAPLALHYGKKSLALAAENDLASVISSEASLQHICIDSKDAEEGVRAFLEKRKPQWRGC